MDNKTQKILVAGQGVLLVLVLTSVGMSFSTMKKVSLSGTSVTEGQQSAVNTQIFSLADDIVANIKSEGSKAHVANIEVNFALNQDAKDFKDLIKLLPEKELIIRNDIIQLLREHTYVELSQDTAQKQLGEEIKRRINELLDTNTIAEVYFSKFFVQ